MAQPSDDQIKVSVDEPTDLTSLADFITINNEDEEVVTPAIAQEIRDLTIGDFTFVGMSKVTRIS